MDISEVSKLYKKLKQKDDLNKVIAAGGGKNESLEIDCPTRWNSLLSMLRKYVHLHQYMSIDPAQKNLDFKCSNYHKEIARKLMDVLEKVEITIKAISAEDANLLASDIALSNLAKELAKLDRDISIAMKTALINRLNQQRTRISDIIWVVWVTKLQTIFFIHRYQMKTFIIYSPLHKQ